MSRDRPPQTAHEAVKFGWTHLAFTCRGTRCSHAGRLDLRPFTALPHASLPRIFERCKCGACGMRPLTASLAFELADDRWHEKRVDFYEGRVLRPSRE